MDDTMTSAYTIRETTLDDAREIAEIYNHYVLHDTASFETTPLTESQMRSRLTDISDYPQYVCEEAGSIVGYCHAKPWKPRSAYAPTLETTIYLRPGNTGGGIGESLMLRLIEECRRRGFRSLIADITGENAGSIRFHERLGFHRVSYFPRVGEKFGRQLDVVDLQLFL